MMVAYNEENIHDRWRVFQRCSGHDHTIRHTGGTFGRRKYHHCSRVIPSYQNTEGCRLRWNPTWNVKALNKKSSACTRVTEENTLATAASLFLASGKVSAKYVENWCREIVEPTLDDTQHGFRTACHSTADQIFILQKFFGKSWEYGKDV